MSINFGSQQFQIHDSHMVKMEHMPGMSDTLGRGRGSPMEIARHITHNPAPFHSVVSNENTGPLEPIPISHAFQNQNLSNGQINDKMGGFRQTEAIVNGLGPQSSSCTLFFIWDQVFNSSLVPSSSFVFELIDAYVASGHFDMLVQILDQLHLKKCSFLHDAYKHAILSLGRKGELGHMEILMKEMTSIGFSVDSVTANAFLVYYCTFGSLSEMEFAYHRLKSSRILIEEEAIRAVSSSYIRQDRFYSLGKFVEDVGLGRRNVGNLLWNLLLLSYASRFKMKSLQREFVRMVEGGFRPDLTTFNIRALAFSQMALFWDLHLSLEHMKHESVIPDIVTYGCVVDCYMAKGLGKNLDFALNKLNVRDYVRLCTDEVVFEVMGKGDFHSSAEAFMEFNSKRNWSYKDLINIYQKKIFRSNQVFWSY